MKFFVVNLKFYDGPSIYMGRAGRGRLGPFGNKFTKEEHGEKALDLFDTWFEREVVTNTSYRESLEALKDGPRALSCFCVQQDGTGRCHVRKIAAWLNARFGL